MLFGLLGKYNPMMLKTVIAKEDEIFSNPPEGIEVVARYAIVGERGGFINIVKTTHAEALGILLSSFVGLIHFEVVPLVDSSQGTVIKIVKETLGNNQKK